MTAEIAILNKTAVALAADSAVSIGRSPNLKIYNTVDKIFELSAHEPVGIMVYGGLDYMGMPLETIIKQYRKTLGNRSFPHVAGYRDHFREHLINNVTITFDDKMENVAAILRGCIEQSHSNIQKLILKDIASTGSFLKSKLNGTAQQFIRRRIDELKRESFTVGFSKKTLPAHYVPIVDAFIDRGFNSFAPTEQTKVLLRAYAGYILARPRFQNTGLG